MDARTLFWTGALANMGLIVLLVANGVRAIRADRVATHRRSMVSAGILVGVFLASYLVKRFAMGPENLSVWSAGARANLWVHESFVAAMLVAGATALVLGRRLARTRRVTARAEDPPPAPAQLLRHRRAGWVAVLAAVGGFLTACGILAGMLARAH